MIPENLEFADFANDVITPAMQAKQLPIIN